MRSFGEFVKTCVVGGFFGVLPIVLIVVVIAQAVALLDGLAEPIVARLPIEELGGVDIARLLSFMLILVACFVVGAVLRTSFGSASVGWLERVILNRMPLYTIVKRVSQRFVGVEEGAVFSAALADIHGTGAMAFVFVIEEHDDGYFTVLVPNAPTPTVGILYCISSDRVRRLDTSLASAVNCIMQWGIGSKELLGPVR